jgi:hypothetical protein
LTVACTVAEETAAMVAGGPIFGSVEHAPAESKRRRNRSEQRRSREWARRGIGIMNWKWSWSTSRADVHRRRRPRLGVVFDAAIARFYG